MPYQVKMGTRCILRTITFPGLSKSSTHQASNRYHIDRAQANACELSKDGGGCGRGAGDSRRDGRAVGGLGKTEGRKGNYRARVAPIDTDSRHRFWYERSKRTDADPAHLFHRPATIISPCSATRRREQERRGRMGRCAPAKQWGSVLEHAA